MRLRRTAILISKRLTESLLVAMNSTIEEPEVQKSEEEESLHAVLNALSPDYCGQTQVEKDDDTSDGNDMLHARVLGVLLSDKTVSEVYNTCMSTDLSEFHPGHFPAGLRDPDPLAAYAPLPEVEDDRYDVAKDKDNEEQGDDYLEDIVYGEAEALEHIGKDEDEAVRGLICEHLRAQTHQLEEIIADLRRMEGNSTDHPAELQQSLVCAEGLALKLDEAQTLLLDGALLATQQAVLTIQQTFDELHVLIADLRQKYKE